MDDPGRRTDQGPSNQAPRTIPILPYYTDTKNALADRVVDGEHRVVDDEIIVGDGKISVVDGRLRLADGQIR